jgi:ABC-type Fe3+/spermidine/putrescine transport system ATPase subunit/ABC-type sulfate transport system permease component
VRRPPVTLAVLSGLLATYLIAPFAAGLAQIGIADWGSVDLSGLASASAVSIASATLATALVAVGGVPLAYLLARRPGPATTLLGLVVQLPLALPPLASGVLLLFLLGFSSPLGRLTDGALTDSFIGITLAEAFVAAPFLIIAARSAFAAVDPELEDVAATLGHRPWAVFIRVNLPLVWRATVAGLLLTWLRAFGEFGATVLVAYHPYSLPVFTYVSFGSAGLPVMMPVLVPTLLAAIGVMIASQFFDMTARRGSRWRKIRASFAASQVRRDPSYQSGKKVARPLDFAFHRRLEGFELKVAWQTSARRLAILGPSGSGKSMTLRLIAGLDQAQKHFLRLNDRDLSGQPTEARGIAYVPQNYGLFPHLTIEKQIRFSVNCDAAAAHHWTDRLGLAGLVDRYPNELSLGQQQRVALARALSRPASLLLLDEPFSALDAPLRARLCWEFLELQRELDATTILVTHDAAEAALLSDDLLVLDTGSVLQSGPSSSVFLRPANESVARLLGAENIGSGLVVGPDRIDVGDGVELLVGGPALEPSRRIGWSVRAEQIRFARDAPYPGRILQAGEVRDGRRSLTVQLGATVLHVLADPGAATQGPCRVSIDPQAVQIWTVT